MRTPRRTLAALLVPLAVLAACSGGDDDDSGDGGAAAPSPCRGASLDGEALLDCIGPSLALVETAIASGSGVLLADGYVVTNAHVVDPYSSADLVFPDGTKESDVPVVGIDAYADIAVLGPLESDGLTPLTLTSGAKVARGADVYLLGYPGEADAEPEPTISRGVLSRTREAGDFDLTYLQTDASIGGGQSGGALVDGAGRLVGISGLSFAEEFALALDGGDVQESVDRIVAGDGDPYAAIPQEGAATEHTQHRVDELDGRAVVFAAEDHERTVEVRLDPPDGLGFSAQTIDYEPLAVNQASIDIALEAGDITESDLDDLDGLGLEVIEPVSPGTYELELPADVESVIFIETPSESPVDVAIHTSEPTFEMPISERRGITLGEPVLAMFDYFEAYDVYTLDLEAGDEVDVKVQSAQGDMGVYIRAPGQSVADMEEFDDGGGGLYDTDAEGTYEAETDGTYRFAVVSYDGVVTGYRLTVTRAEPD